VKLYQQGLAPLLIFFGGPGDGAISEPQAMRKLAISMGVPDAAILLY
jgi:vancomycin permeability regulator SanA